ncbi:MAG: 5'/3'-nucleotidase SurE [Lachnospiraceae bacterium]|nr:5'/3'-nucleotidase SurE [Lachnospiraceae bacterium]
MKTILITNDDGIMADGLIRLARAAKSFGEVWVIAPEIQRSCTSHSITLHTHIDVSPYPLPVQDVHAFSCSGMPADCVRVGMLYVLPRKPDVVLSGINYGYNSATDIQYSATAGAALEASFQGAHGIALSEQAVKCHEVTDCYLEQVLEEWIDVRTEAGEIVNINFPGCHISEFRGILTGRTVSACRFFSDDYTLKEKLPDGGVRLMLEGKLLLDSEEGTDKRALTENYISVGIVRNIS